MISALWRWFSGSRLVGAMLVGIAIGGYTAWHIQALRYEVRLARLQANMLHAHQIQDDIATHTETTTHANLSAIEDQARRLTSQIPRYMDSDDTLAQSVPPSFVYLYNAAFTGATPSTSTRADDRSSRISFTELADAHITNASICQQWREQALAWRTFYQQLRDAQEVRR